MEFQNIVNDDVTRVINAQSTEDFLYQQGYFHAKDRFVQMEMLRIVASGRICELLDDSEANYAIDKHMRELGIYHFSTLEINELSSTSKALLEKYCDGVNEAITKKIPLEFKLMGHRPAKWTLTDCIVSIKAMSYLGLAQGQQDLEKLFFQMLSRGVCPKKINSLSNFEMGELRDETLHLLEKVRFYNPLLPESYNFLKNLPKVQASNNWLYKNSDGHVVHASDPHLEVNRLPAVWYEIKAKIENRDILGISMPGVPGIVMGRTNNLSFSFTYGFMDMIDFFIEEIRSNKFRDESEFTNFNVRREKIKRKKHEDVDILIRHTHAGVLDAPSDKPLLQDGYYFSVAWSCRDKGSAKTLESILGIFNSENISDLKTHVSNVSISCNWLLADNNGNMSYQQSGLLPKRASSGLLPQLAWKRENRWSGIYDAKDLYNFDNPDCGHIVTANNMIHEADFPKAINAPMESYRHDRILELLKIGNDQSVEDTMNLQSDLISIQAREFISQFKEEFSKSEKLKSLCTWDFSYSTDSKSATLFEEFYRVLIRKFFSTHLFGKSEILYCLDETSFIADFYGLFDRLFLKELSDDDKSLWFSQKSKEDYVMEAIESVKPSGLSWGEQNKLDMNYILLDGKLPAWLKIDKRDVPIAGNRATVVQGQVFKSHGRATSFCPSWKLITNMGNGDIYTVLPGGLNDRPLSKYFKSDLERWLNFKYRKNSI
jgi:penicillin amidase